MGAYILTCPQCGYRADIDTFAPSLCGECWCPKCGLGFIFEHEDDEDDEGE